VVISISRRICSIRPLNGLGFAGAFDDGRVVAIDADQLGLTELADLDLVELDAEVLHDRLAAGEDRDVLEHRPCGGSP